MDNTTKSSLADSVAKILEQATPQEYQEVLKMAAMKRPWRPKHTGWVNVFDQFLHMVYAVLILFPIVGWPSYWTAITTGLTMGAIREWEQYKNWDLKILMFWDRLQDASFFAIGALLIYHFLK